MHPENRNDSDNRLTSRTGILVVMFVLFSAVAGLAFLASDARRDIDDLAKANTDNLEWSLGQLEVESLKFQRELIRAANSDTPDLAALRRTYDIFYSRIESLTARSFYRHLMDEPEVRALHDRVVAFRTDALRFIDARDADLTAAIPYLSEQVSAVLPNIRALSLASLATQAGVAEQARSDVLGALDRLALLGAAFFLSLVAVAIGFSIVARIARVETGRRADAMQRLETVVNTSLDGIMVIDPYGKVIAINPAAEKIFGYSEDEAVGHKLQDLVVPDRLQQAFSAALERYRAGKSHLIIGKGRVRFEAVRKNGEAFPIEFSLSKTGESERGEMVAYLRDVSKEVEDEQSLITARDNAMQGERAKARLLAVMSHEIRTPLNGLIGTIDLLSDTEMTPQQQNYLRNMKSSGNILMRHVNDVLDISRLDVERYEIQSVPFEVHEILDEVVETQQDAACASGNNLVGRIVDQHPPRLLGDPARITQVLLNLVGNANKFTQDGQVSVECEYDGRTNQLEFRVADTGTGIPADVIDTIFEDFVTLDDSYQRRADGTGLGLGIARRLVKAMGGEISVESEPGVGTVFSFSLPAVPAVKPQTDALARTSLSDTWQRRAILLVEDNEINRLVAREMLTQLGHHVTEATNGDDAIQKAGQKAFDLILMDISMPGKDGITTAHEIRSSGGANHETPILALTANVLPADQARFAAAGISHTILKPVTKAILRRELEALSGLKPAASTSPLDHEDKLAELRETLGADVVAQKIEQFQTEVGSFVEDLKNETESWSDEDLAKLLHKHAGSAAVFGRPQLRAALLNWESQIRQGQNYQLAEIARDLDLVLKLADRSSHEHN